MIPGSAGMATLAAIGLVLAAVIGIGPRDDVPRGARLAAGGVALGWLASTLAGGAPHGVDALVAGGTGGAIGWMYGRRDLGERALPLLTLGAALASVLAAVSRYLEPGVPYGDGRAVTIGLAAFAATVLGAWAMGAAVVRLLRANARLGAALALPQPTAVQWVLTLAVLGTAVPVVATPTGWVWLVLAGVLSGLAGLLRVWSAAPEARAVLGHVQEACVGGSVAFVGLAASDDLILISGGLLLGVGVALSARQSES